MKLTADDGVVQARKAADQASGRDAPIRFVFGESEVVDAVRVETGARATAVNAARFELAEVHESSGEQLVRTTDEQARRYKQIRIAQVG